MVSVSVLSVALFSLVCVWNFAVYCWDGSHGRFEAGQLLRCTVLVILVFLKQLGVQIVQGKAAPLQAWNGPEGSRKLRFPDFMTTAQDGGKVVSLTHWPPLPAGNAHGTHFC
jgi:hypothetical protein